MSSELIRALAGLVAAGVCALESRAIVFRGLSHLPQGSAMLTVSSGDHLVVSGIGGTGADGVSIATTEAESWAGSFAAPAPGAPAGAWMEMTARGIAGADVVETLAIVRLENVDSKVSLSAVYPYLATPPVEVTVFLGDAPVASASGLSGPLAEFVPGALRANPVYTDAAGVWTSVRLDQAGSIAITGLAPVFGDRIAVHVPSAAALQSVSEVRIHAASTGPITIRDEWIEKFGNPHLALGPTSLAAIGTCPACSLVAAPLAPGQEYGVAVVPRPADRIAIEWLAPDAMQSLPTGASLTLEGRGAVDGVPDVDIGFVRISDSGASLSILSEFVAIGSPQKIVLAYRNGALVAQVIGLSSPLVATVSDDDWPVRSTADRRLLPLATPALTLAWLRAVPVALNAGPVVIADELRIHAQSPSGDVDSLSTFSGIGDDIPELDILSDSADPICPGDIDGDNSVGLSDLSTLLENFGTIGGMTHEDGDLTGDHNVLIDDLSILLTSFGVDCGIEN